MPGLEPKSATPIVPGATIPLGWEFTRDLLATARLYWLATAHPTGRPHMRPVLAVWADGPYQPYEITPATVFGFGTAQGLAARSTRWTF